MATSTWNEVRRIRDELQLKVHLAGMDARDRWNDLEPRLASVEAVISNIVRELRREIADELDPERPR